MRRPRPLLIGRSGPDRLMPVIMAPMAYIAALALIVVGLAQDLAQDWRAGLDGVLTGEIPAGADFAETEARVGTAVRVLHARPDVAAVEVITAEGADRMLQQWVGDAIDLSGFPPADPVGCAAGRWRRRGGGRGGRSAGRSAGGAADPCGGLAGRPARAGGGGGGGGRCRAGAGRGRGGGHGDRRVGPSWSCCT